MYVYAISVDSFITSPRWPVRTNDPLPLTTEASTTSVSPPACVHARPVLTPTSFSPRSVSARYLGGPKNLWRFAVVTLVIPALMLVGGTLMLRYTWRTARRDSEILAAEVTQINTGRGCHLSATQVAEGLESLSLRDITFVFIENVGNMVCPASYKLGEHRRVAMLSVPEGDDKVAKYPTLFQAVDAILLSKIDLLKVLDFDAGRVRDDLARINTRAPLIELSARTGDGFQNSLPSCSV